MMRPTRRDADHADVRAEMRLDARARARGPHRSGATGTPAPRFSRNLRFALAALLALAGRCTAAGLDCASTSAALATLGACASGADEACCAALGGWNDAGCFCPGVESAVSQSDTYAAQAAALAAACGVAKADLATHATCAALSAGEGAAGAAESTNPEPATWAYVVLDASNPASPRFRLVWSAETAGGVDRSPTASFEVTHCAPGYPPSEAACAQSMTTQTVDVPLDASIDTIDAQYSLEVPQTPSAPVTAFVSLTAVAGDGARSAPLGPFRETANHGASADGARDNAARVFIAPDASDAVSADASACGAHWAPCADLTVALAAAVASGATFTEAAPAEVVFLPGEHASAGNCGVELGAAMPVRVSGLVGSRPRARVRSSPNGTLREPTVPAPFASIECGSAPNAGGLVAKPPHAVRIRALEIKNATRATGGGLFASGAGVNVEVTDTVFRACSAGGAGGGVAALDGAAVALADSAALDCAGGADGTGNEVRGGGVYVAGADTVASLRNFSAIGCSLPEENGKGGGVNVDGGASLTVDGLLVADCVSFFAGGVFVGTGCAPAIANAVVRDNAATYGAGIGAFAHSAATLRESSVFGNVAAEWGGGVLAYTQSTLTLTDDTVLYENEAQLGGGAHAYVDSTLVVADGARIERNAASVSGGGAFLNAGADATFEGENTAVENNVARDIDGGGGIAVLVGASAVFQNGAALRANRAERGGGGGATCAGAGASLAFRGDAVVSENVAATRGGGVLASRGCVVEIEGSPSEADLSSSRFSRSVVFSGNAVQVDEERCRPGVFGGGAVALEPNIDAEADAAEADAAGAEALSETTASPTALRAARCAFQNNSAPDGGAVFVAPSDEMNASGDRREVARAAVVDVQDVDVERNKAYGCVGGAAGARCGDAGAARVTAASSAALYANVTSPDASVAGGEGGGVFAAAGSIALRAGCLFAENEAADSGGGVRVAVAASLFAFGAGSRFERNVARAGSGGGVSHEGLALALLGPDVVFEENRALDGGAVAVVIEPATAALVASRASFFFEALLAYVPEERRVPDVAFAVAGADMRGNAAGRRGGSVYLSAPLAHGALERLTVRDAQAVAGEAVYWTRAASPEAALACEACDLGGASAGAEPAAAAGGGGALASLSGEMIGVATEALEVSFAGGVALPAELASAASAPAFAASLVDFYGRVAATENGVACRIEPAAVPAAGDPSAGTAAAEDAAVADALELGGALEASSEGGLVVFDGVVPRGRLGSTYEARIACADRAPASSAASDVVSQNAARNAARNASDAEDVAAIAPVTFPVRIATCARGREPVVVGADSLTGAPVAKDCVECKDRTFNFDGVACVACPPGGDCRGGDELLAKPGWWRSAEEAQRVFACPTKSACLPGNATGDAACAEGYEGPVCAVCASGFRQWGRACVPCDDAATYALPIFGIVAFSAFLWYIFREPPGDPSGDAPAAELACEDARGDAPVKEPPVKESPVASDGAEDRAMALFSSLVFIAQCLGLLKEYDVAFPDGVDRVLDALDLTNLNLSALAPGCTDDSVNFYRSFVVGVSVPPAIVCACALVYHRAEAARRRHYAAFPRRTRTEHDAYESLKRRCARNAAWLLTLAYSGTAKTTFQLYNARRLDTGSFLRRDYSINVDGSGARVYSLFSGVGAVALLAYPVGIPLAVAAILLRGARGNKLDDETFKQKYGFLYAAYKPSFVAWELTGLITKCFLAAVPVFATESTLRGGSNEEGNKGSGSFDVGAGGGFALACQSTLAQAACLSLLVAILWLRPHRKAIHSAQQSAAVAVVIGWVLVLGNVLNVDAGDGAGVAFDDDEKFRVCFAAVAATLAAVVAMVAASFLAGELNAPARTARAAVKTARRSFKRLVSRARLGGEGGKTRELAFGLDAAETGASSTNEKTKTKTKKKAEALLDDDAPPGARRASFYERVDGDLHSSTVEVRIAPGADRA